MAWQHIAGLTSNQAEWAGWMGAMTDSKLPWGRQTACEGGVLHFDERDAAVLLEALAIPRGDGDARILADRIREHVARLPAS
jgi:hypothetical protein